MRLAAIVISLITNGFAACAHAGPAVERLCQEIMSRKSSSAEQSVIPQIGLGQILSYVFDPAGSVELTRLEGGDLQVSTGQEFAPNDELLLLMMGDGHSPSERDLEVLTDAQWAARKLERNLNGLRAQTSVSDCLKKADEYGVTDEYFESTSKEIQNGLDVQAVQTSAAMFQVAASVAESDEAHRISVSGLTSYTGFSDALSRDSSGSLDVVLVMHGTKEGFLVDHSGMAIPPNFFAQWLRAHPETVGRLRSLSIYSCYPDQVAKVYGSSLAALQEKGISVYFPKNSGALDRVDTIPLNSLPFFIRELMALDPRK